MKRLAFCLLAVLAAAPASIGQDEKDSNSGRVRIGLVTKSPTWVAQKVSFYVELMSPTFFSGSPRFDLPEIPGVILMKVEGRPVLGTKSIDGETWTTQRHEFRAYAHREGRISIPAFPVRFSIAPAFGSPPEEQRMVTAAVAFEAKMPPGGKGVAMLVSTSQLDVTDSWNPMLDDERSIRLQVGDAIEREINLRAAGVPGMALPPIRLPKPDGLTAYPNVPAVSDQTDRGDLIGSRTESVTYICQRAGNISIPTQVITWWDIEANQLHHVTLEAVTIKVEASAAVAEDASQDVATSKPPGSRGKAVATTLALAVVIAAGTYWFRKYLAPWLKARRQRNVNSPKALFERVQRACLAGNPKETYNAVVRWLDTISCSSSSTTVTVASLQTPLRTPAVEFEWNALQRAVVREDEHWNGEALLIELTQLKRQLKRSERDLARRRAVLPELNPRG